MEITGVVSTTFHIVRVQLDTSDPSKCPKFSAGIQQVVPHEVQVEYSRVNGLPWKPSSVEAKGFILKGNGTLSNRREYRREYTPATAPPWLREIITKYIPES